MGFEITDTGIRFGDVPNREQKRSEKQRAADWLREILKPGESTPSADVLAEAEECGLSVRTVRRAATEVLGIKPVQIRKNNKIEGWTWTLPTDT